MVDEILHSKKRKGDEVSLIFMDFLTYGKILLTEEFLHHLECIKPCKYWDKLPTSTGAGFLPSTV